MTDNVLLLDTTSEEICSSFQGLTHVGQVGADAHTHVGGAPHPHVGGAAHLPGTPVPRSAPGALFQVIPILSPQPIPSNAPSHNLPPRIPHPASGRLMEFTCDTCFSFSCRCREEADIAARNRAPPEPQPVVFSPTAKPCPQDPVSGALTSLAEDRANAGRDTGYLTDKQRLALNAEINQRSAKLRQQIPPREDGASNHSQTGQSPGDAQTTRHPPSSPAETRASSPLSGRALAIAEEQAYWQPTSPPGTLLAALSAPFGKEDP